MITVQCNWCPWSLSGDDVEEVILADHTHQETQHDDVRPKQCYATDSGGYRCERLDPHGENGHWISDETRRTRMEHAGVDFRSLTTCPDHGIPDCSPMLNGCTVMATAQAAQIKRRTPPAAIPGLVTLLGTAVPERGARTDT